MTEDIPNRHPHWRGSHKAKLAFLLIAKRAARRRAADRQFISDIEAAYAQQGKRFQFLLQEDIDRLAAIAKVPVESCPFRLQTYFRFYEYLPPYIRDSLKKEVLK